LRAMRRVQLWDWTQEQGRVVWVENEALWCARGMWKQVGMLVMRETVQDLSR
jgi:hypothetical protein